MTIRATTRWTQRELELGGAAVELRKRGVRWTDIAESLGLADDQHARRLAGRYLLAASVAERDGQCTVTVPPCERGL